MPVFADIGVFTTAVKAMLPTETARDNESLQTPISTLASRIRILLGLLQGFLLYALYTSWEAKTGVATQARLFVPALMLTAFLPVVAASGVGHLSRRNLLRWLAALTVILCALGWYDAWRADLSSLLPQAGKLADACCGGAGEKSPALPSPALFMLAMGGLFIAQTMILAGNADGRRIAGYQRYFEMAWKLLVQLMFATLFTGLFWLVLQTGNALFSLIRLDFLSRLIEKSWFNIPVTTLAFSFALHVSDVRPHIVVGIRRLLLTLQSWLLPVATIVIGAFLLSILATGLEPLWQTRRASHVLLGATALLVVLINTVYQDGAHPDQQSRFFRICTHIACLLPIPLVLLAVYSLGLRVAEYGWTVSRIAGAACALIAAMYAGGYGYAALRLRDNLQRIATTNIVVSFAILLLAVAVLSPLADPARVAVADQMRRLESGKTAPEQFDIDFLRFDSARFGLQALQQLSVNTEGAHAADLKEKALVALAAKNRYSMGRSKDNAANAKPDLAKNIRMHPAERQLPQEFAAQDWRDVPQSWELPPCLTSADAQCDAYFVRPDAGSAEQLLIFDSLRPPSLFMLVMPVAPLASAASEKNKPAPVWQLIGRLRVLSSCIAPLRQAAEKGMLNWQLPPTRDVVLNGVRLTMHTAQTDAANCTATDGQN